MRELHEEQMKLKKEVAAVVLELSQNLKTCRSASLFDRNPYLHSRKAKRNLRALEESVTRMIHTLFMFMAMLAKDELCERTIRNDYFLSYQFLFGFQDGIKKHEMEHCILVQDKKILNQFEEFFMKTWDVLEYLD